MIPSIDTHKMTPDPTQLTLLLLVTFSLSEPVACFETPTNSCAVAIHQLLSKAIPEFDINKKSLSIELGKVQTNHYIKFKIRCQSKENVSGTKVTLKL